MTAAKYIFFAVCATLINLGMQYICLHFYQGFLSLYIAMFFGTLIGLVVKYILDKKYIFYHTPKNKRDDGKKFVLYSLMGIVTTSIFWICEISFDFFIQHESAKYIGAIIGLSIGYVVKYILDKKFVFKH